MGGKACIRDTQVTLSAVMGLLSSGHTEADIIRMFPMLTEADIRETLAYAAYWLDGELLEAAAVAEEPTPEGFGMRPRIGPVPWSTVKEESAEPAPLPRLENMLLFHPSWPDQPVITLSREGLHDRRWSDDVIAWPEIENIERIRGQKNIHVTLRRPQRYITGMTFFQRLHMQVKLLLNVRTFYLDTTGLTARTKDIYYTAHRLWIKYRNVEHRRKKRRKSAPDVNSPDEQKQPPT